MMRKSTYLVIAAELVVFHIVLQVEIKIMFLNNLNCIRDYYELLQISLGLERISYKQFKMEPISLHKSIEERISNKKFKMEQIPLHKFTEVVKHVSAHMSHLAFT
jgi:hypothetical protein